MRQHFCREIKKFYAKMGKSNGNFLMQNEVSILSDYYAFMQQKKYLFLKWSKNSELGTSLFEIALSLFALERTLILRAMALLETKSEAL